MYTGVGSEISTILLFFVKIYYIQVKFPDYCLSNPLASCKHTLRFCVPLRTEGEVNTQRASYYKTQNSAIHWYIQLSHAKCWSLLQKTIIINGKHQLGHNSFFFNEIQQKALVGLKSGFTLSQMKDTGNLIPDQQFSSKLYYWTLLLNIIGVQGQIVQVYAPNVIYSDKMVEQFWELRKRKMTLWISNSRFKCKSWI